MHLAHQGWSLAFCFWASSIVWVWLICDWKLTLLEGKDTYDQPLAVTNTWWEVRMGLGEWDKIEETLQIKPSEWAWQRLKCPVSCGPNQDQSPSVVWMPGSEFWAYQWKAVCHRGHLCSYRKGTTGARMASVYRMKPKLLAGLSRCVLLQPLAISVGHLFSGYLVPTSSQIFCRPYFQPLLPPCAMLFSS